MSSSADKPVRHILALSGGKDSSALAVFMKDKIPDMEYVFCDTEKELDETYEYMQRLSQYLGKPIKTLKYKAGYGFDEILKLKRGFLPSQQSRWCTQYLKLIPYEEFIGSDNVISYVGIRADEPYRTGYISTKPNIKAVFPFIEHNIRKADVLKIQDLVFQPIMSGDHVLAVTSVSSSKELSGLVYLNDIQIYFKRQWPTRRLILLQVSDLHGARMKASKSCPDRNVSRKSKSSLQRSRQRSPSVRQTSLSKMCLPMMTWGIRHV